MAVDNQSNWLRISLKRRWKGGELPRRGGRGINDSKSDTQTDTQSGTQSDRI